MRAIIESKANDKIMIVDNVKSVTNDNNVAIRIKTSQEDFHVYTCNVAGEIDRVDKITLTFEKR